VTPYLHMHAICSCTVFSFDPEPAQRLRPIPSGLVPRLRLKVFVSTIHPHTVQPMLEFKLIPSARTLNFRSTRHQRSNCVPILALFAPGTPASSSSVHALHGRLVDTVIQGTMPSIRALNFRSTRTSVIASQSTPFLLLCITLPQHKLVFARCRRTLFRPSDRDSNLVSNHYAICSDAVLSVRPGTD
jgi:hypothetical protein